MAQSTQKTYMAFHKNFLFWYKFRNVSIDILSKFHFKFRSHTPHNPDVWMSCSTEEHNIGNRLGFSSCRILIGFTIRLNEIVPIPMYWHPLKIYSTDVLTSIRCIDIHSKYILFCKYFCLKYWHYCLSPSFGRHHLGGRHHLVGIYFTKSCG